MAKTKYTQIVADLERAIQCADLRPGDRLPSYRGIKAKYGVATATVRQAMRELQSRGLTTSDPKRHPVVMDRASRVRNIGVAIFIDGDHDWLIQQAVESVRDLLEQRQMAVALHYVSPSHPGAVERFFAWARTLDGIIIRDVVPAGVAERLTDMGIKTVFMGAAGEQAEFDRVSRVGVPVAEATRAAGSFLFGMGHTRVVFVNRSGSPYYASLGAAFRALAGGPSNTPWCQELVLASESSEVDLISQLKAMEEPPTALLVEGGMRASRLINYLSIAGWSVPGRLSVLALSSSASPSMVRPGLSMVLISLAEAFIRAFGMLDGLTNGSPNVVRHEVLPFQFVTGDTCQPPLRG